MNKDKVIKDFLDNLKKQSSNNLFLEDCDNEGLREIFEKHFGLVCKKCGGTDIFVSWEDNEYGNARNVILFLIFNPHEKE